MRWLLLILTLLAAAPADAQIIITPRAGAGGGGGGTPIPIAYVNSTQVASTGSSASISTPSFAVTAGNLIFAITRMGSGGNPTAVTDTIGNYYQPLERVDPFCTLQWWYTVSSATHASNVVTSTFSFADSFNAISVGQFSGLAGISPMDVFAYGNQTTTALTSTASDALVIVAANVNGTGGTWTAGTGFTKAVEDSLGMTTVTYKIVSAQQVAQTYTLSNSAGTHHGVLAVVFNAPTSN